MGIGNSKTGIPPGVLFEAYEWTQISRYQSPKFVVVTMDRVIGSISSVMLTVNITPASTSTNMTFRFSMSIEMSSSRRLAIFSHQVQSRCRQMLKKTPRVLGRKFSRIAEEPTTLPPPYFPTPALPLISAPLADGFDAWYEARPANAASSDLGTTQSVVSSLEEDSPIDRGRSRARPQENFYRGDSCIMRPRVPYITVQDYSSKQQQQVHCELDPGMTCVGF